MKEVSLDTTLYELTEKYPELIPVLVDMGFAGVADPELRKGHGKVMTIRKGCEMHGKPLSEAVKTLESKGYKIVA
jgi:hypothetical protein